MKQHLSLMQRSTGVRIFLAISVALSLNPISGRAQSSDTDAAITLDAASSEVDYRTNTVLFRDLSITQGETRVTAERARST